MMSQLKSRRNAALAMLVLFGGSAVLCARGSSAISQPQSVDAPVAVPFVGMQDVFSRNALGDAIVITAVHGTADAIAIGNTYRIDGAYTLASHDQATLASYLTATKPDEPHRSMITNQSVTLHKGSGTFTVFLKVEDPGCPHVTFYPVGGGEGFAGEYFGTDDFIPPPAWQVRK